MSMLELLHAAADHAVEMRCEVLSGDPTQGLKTRLPKGVTLPIDVAFFYGILGTWQRCGRPMVYLDLECVPRFGCDAPPLLPRSPWRAWVIVLPPSRVITLGASDGTRESIEAIIAVQLEHEWSYLLTGQRVSFSGVWVEPEAMLDELAVHPPNPAYGTMPVDDQDARAIARARKLILNTALALEGYDGVMRVGPERPAAIPGRLPAGDYELASSARPVTTLTIDVRR